MKTLICLSLTLASAFAADPVLRARPVPHDASQDGTRPGLMPGVAGVGYETGDFLPCINCYGAPAGSLVLPPTADIIAPYKQLPLIFYFTVETGDVSGQGTFSLQVTEASTGKVVISTSADNTPFTANATNILGFATDLPDSDGYKGLEKVAYTATVGGLTTKGTAYIWVLHHTPGS
jgi:hypothetical protein